MDNYTNLVKLCVGADSVEDLIAWRSARQAENPEAANRHVTRMWPKREAELLNGGSLYWVFKGVILARQRILRLDEVIGADGIRRCGIVLDPELVRTRPAPRRTFQGWRYLAPGDSPPDLPRTRPSEDSLPPALSAALAEIGIR
ncbi:DUF1489 family protein [Actibacterium sp. XHP0104]|uniref:DUF1489 family protein n=1 Tax=Actibacterium sp. XHP0104 TaxID=2984335 RepID=UPI0021E917F5|nr:DUF1489 domain-containing protein [Actibacterium sp. XHP0104]MCV2882690.1 DUF1489 domain-containing protein [Actibacterium sp. XHP0104]